MSDDLEIDDLEVNDLSAAIVASIENMHLHKQEDLELTAVLALSLADVQANPIEIIWSNEPCTDKTVVVPDHNRPTIVINFDGRAEMFTYGSMHLSASYFFDSRENRDALSADLHEIAKHSRLRTLLLDTDFELAYDEIRSLMSFIYDHELFNRLERVELAHPINVFQDIAVLRTGLDVISEINDRERR